MRITKMDITAFLAVLMIAPLCSWFLHAGFMLAMLFYFGSLALYFSWRWPQGIARALLISLPTIPICLVFDYIAFINNTWVVPTIFSFRILTLIPLEDFIFSFLMVYTIVIMYGYLRGRDQAVNYRRFAIFCGVVMVGAIIFFTIRWLAPTLFLIPYYYAWVLLFVFIVPTAVGLIFFPHLRRSILVLVPYFFIWMLSWEFIALKLGMWSFPSNEYIARLSVFGLHFPLEEFLTWMILMVPMVIILAELGIGHEPMRSIRLSGDDRE